MIFKLLYILFVNSPFGWASIWRPQNLPCDESNRHNKKILLWFTFTSPERFPTLGLTHRQLIWKSIRHEEFFIGVCPWLAYDMWESLSHVPVKRS